MKNHSQAIQGDDEFRRDVYTRLSVVGEEADIGYPKSKCIHHLFEAQVEATPNHIALTMEPDRLTYRQLDEKSNQFAHFLQKRGVKPEVLVGICLDRSLNLVIAILSILKAGGAYVPIDPDYPRDRIEFMLTDSNCPILITSREVKLNLPEISAEVICYDESIPEIERQSSAKVDSKGTPDNLAYVIYTSGSTGRPKGVMVEHRNVVRLLFNDKFQFDFDQHDVWSIFHSFCFDFSVWEMFGALLYGGRAVIIPKEEARDPRAFADILVREKVTVVNQTPSAFYNLIPRLLDLSKQSLFIRYVIFGGEKLNPGKLESVKRKYPLTKFINMYGITETTVHVTYKELTEKEIAEGFSNIGGPIPTLKVYIFDRNMQLAPVGSEGELCVSGAGVARGYLNRDELTKEKFIPNPLNPAEVIYRSGDLASVRENGDIEYFGRMDTQIQLRGFRIELGEIEAAITRMEEIEDCVVICDQDDNGEDRIVAYIIPFGPKVAADRIRRSLAERLPDYMIPTFFINIDRMPLTDNGKLDQKRLPRPDIENIFFNQYTAPENETEKGIAQIWGNLLKIESEKIGRNYNFFEIGGQSLAAATVVQNMREKFKKAVTLKHIYENPELCDLGLAVMEMDDIEDQPLCEVDDETSSLSGSFPIISAQLICWLVKFRLKSNYSNVCEIYSVEGEFAPSYFQAALNDVAERHDSLWHPFSSKQPSITISEPTRCEVEMVHLPDENEKRKEIDLKELIIEILHRPFDLTQPPFLRVAIIRNTKENHLLLVSFPHIICDVASLNAFICEVFDTYISTKENNTLSYQERKTNSLEIVKNEIDYLNGEDYLKDLAFWKERLADQEFLKFKRDYFLPLGEPTGRKSLAKIKLDEDILSSLQKISRQSNTSTQLIILALIQSTLRTMTNQNDISTAMVCDIRGVYAYPPVAQMNSTVIEVRSKFSENMTYLDLISHIKWFLVDALNHVKLPSSLIFTTHAYIGSALKNKPVFALVVKLFIKIRIWRWRKSKVSRTALSALITYISGMMALLKDVKKKNKSLQGTFPIAFNVLPDFYEDKVLWSNSHLKVINQRERELTMDPHVFEERSRYMDALMLNIDLLRDKNDDAYLYLWGGRFNEKAFAFIKKVFFIHLKKMTEDPAGTIFKDDSQS